MSRYGRLGASSRVRSLQFLPLLAATGVEVTVAPLLSDGYLQRLYSDGKKGLGQTISSYARRCLQLYRAKEFDLLWIEYEVFPWIPSCIEQWFTGRTPPYVVDYDDAIYHRYDQHPNLVVRAILREKIDAVMRKARLVITGNDYLADHARAAGARNVAYLPTVVDTDRYQPPSRREGGPLKIGWIGSPVTARNLSLIAPALRRVTETGTAQVVLVGAGCSAPMDVSVEIRKWTEDSEISDIQSFDVGIMPLPNEPFERGKCGYKLIQYMACGLPVIASPVGVNVKIVDDGITGFLADDSDEWLLSISKLAKSPELRASMGAAGRKRAESDYSLRTAAVKLQSLLMSAAQT